MSVRLLSSPHELARYDEWLAAHPQATLWQSLGWKRYQDALGRETRTYVAEDDAAIIGSALVVIDRTSFGLSTWDIPRGPLGRDNRWQMVDGSDERKILLEKIISDAQEDRCMSLYLSPLSPLPSNIQRLTSSPRHEQPEATRIIDLQLSDEELLKQMHPKGRYNIGVAEKHGVRVEQSDDAAAFHELLAETAARDDFRVGGRRQYEVFLREVPHAFLLLAYEGTREAPIAGLMGTVYGTTGIYYYGASDYAHRPLMAPYLLQWTAMQRCRAQGAAFYDLLGVAPPDAGPGHPWHGISGFKAKFGGRVVLYPGEQQITLKPVTKALLRAKRKILG